MVISYSYDSKKTLLYNELKNIEKYLLFQMLFKIEGNNQIFTILAISFSKANILKVENFISNVIKIKRTFTIIEKQVCAYF